MLKDNKKIILIGALALLVLIIISVFALAPFDTAGDTVNIPIDKNSNIVTDGEYIFFNSPEGNVMVMHAFETTPEIWIAGWKVLSVSDTNLVLQKDKETIAVFNREEKGIEETYTVKTDTAYCTAGAVYYKDAKTKHIMQIDRVTKEEVVFLNSPVNDFMIVEDKLIIAQGGDNKGVALFDYSTGAANLYVPDKEIKAVTFLEDMIIYTDAKDEVRKLHTKANYDMAVEDVGTKSLCYSKGVYFYVDKAKGGYRLGTNYTDEFR